MISVTLLLFFTFPQSGFLHTTISLSSFGGAKIHRNINDGAAKPEQNRIWAKSASQHSHQKRVAFLPELIGRKSSKIIKLNERIPNLAD